MSGVAAFHKFGTNFRIYQEALMDSVPIRQTQTQTQVIVNSFVRSVYNWMAIGLGLTGFVAYYVSNSPSLLNIIFGNMIVFWGLIIGELVLVFTLSRQSG